MILRRRIRVGSGYIDGVLIKLPIKNFILLKGKRGYVMCGYLNLSVAQKVKDVAVKITGVSSVEDALNAKVHSCTSNAKKLGIYKGQPIKDALKIIV